MGRDAARQIMRVSAKVKCQIRCIGGRKAAQFF